MFSFLIFLLDFIKIFPSFPLNILELMNNRYDIYILFYLHSLNHHIILIKILPEIPLNNSFMLE